MICLTLMRLISAELRNENETDATELGTECAMFIAGYHPSPLVETFLSLKKTKQGRRSTATAGAETHTPNEEISHHRPDWLVHRLIYTVKEFD